MKYFREETLAVDVATRKLNLEEAPLLGGVVEMNVDTCEMVSLAAALHSQSLSVLA